MLVNNQGKRDRTATQIHKQGAALTQETITRTTQASAPVVVPTYQVALTEIARVYQKLANSAGEIPTRITWSEDQEAYLVTLPTPTLKVTKSEEGNVFSVTLPNFPFKPIAQGSTMNEALANAMDVIQGYMED
jgi:hypothetical protein